MIRTWTTARAGQRGVALLVVLWASTLLSILLGGYAVLARTEGLQARHQSRQVEAGYAAEAGLARAAWGLAAAPAQRWRADGRPYAFAFETAQVVVSAVSEQGKVDLNSAPPDVLARLFAAAGVAPDAAARLAAAVVAWRSPATAADAAYAHDGRSYLPRHAPFASVEELGMVLGMTPALYRRVEPAVTIWSGRAAPDPATAPALALAAIPGLDAVQVAALLAARDHAPGAGAPATDNGSAQGIKSVATLADGTRAELRATIRLRPAQAGARPYAILRWREGTEP